MVVVQILLIKLVVLVIHNMSSRVSHSKFVLGEGPDKEKFRRNLLEYH